MQISQDVEIEREIAANDSRPDFVIYNGEETYLIENKINDHNQHFGQYDKTFNVAPERFGYIANYVIPQPKQDKHYQIDRQIIKIIYLKQKMYVILLNLQSQ